MFDPELNPAAWFDPELIPEAWFDHDLIGLVMGPLAMIGVASQMLVETQAPDPGHDMPLDPRDPLAVGTGSVIAVFALYAGFRALHDIKLRQLPQRLCFSRDGVRLRETEPWRFYSSRLVPVVGGSPINGWLGLVLYVVISPAYYAYMQSGLNSVWEAQAAEPRSNEPTTVTVQR